jgi:hypothetical protein
VLSTCSATGAELVFGSVEGLFLPLQIMVMGQVAAAIKKPINKMYLISVPLLTRFKAIVHCLSKGATVPD